MDNLLTPTDKIKKLCATNDIDSIQSFLESAHDDEDLQNIYSEGFTSACETGQLKTVQYLLDRKEISFNVDTDAAKFFGLLKAYEYGHLPVCQYLIIDHGVVVQPLYEVFLEDKPELRKMMEIEKMKKQLEQELPVKECGRSRGKI